MYVGVLGLDLLLGDVHSLKEKRVGRAARSWPSCARRFEVAAAEAGHLDLHRRALSGSRWWPPTRRTASRCSTRASGWSPAGPRSSCCRHGSGS